MGTSRMAVSGKQVTLDGFWWQNPTPVSGKSIITVNKDADSCTVTHCAITGFGLTEDNVTDTKWVSLYGTHHTVANCSFSDKRNMGTLLVVWFETSVVPSHTIRNNYFSRPATLLDTDGSPKNGQESIRIGTSDYSMQEGACRVEGNYFYHCHGEQAEIISNKSCKNLYTGNLVVESKGSITMRHGNNCTVENNIILGNQMEGTGGIRLIGEGHRVENNYLEGLAGTGYCTGICLVRGEPNAVASGYWQVKQATVIGNTLVDCRYAFHVNYGARTTQTLPVISTTIQNNVVSLSSSSMYAVKCYTSPEPEITWQNNTLYGGKQEGISLTTVSQQPTISAPTQRATAIRQAAGCGYTLQ